MNPFNLEPALIKKQADLLYRSRYVLESSQGAVVKIQGKSFINFCSNDYLGMANHPKVIATFQQAANIYGVGSGASHLMTGHHKLHRQLELFLANFTNRQEAVLFSSGYMANLGVIQTLIGKQDAVFEDRLNHASLLDGGLASGARFQRYLHCNPQSLKKKLEATSALRKLIITDSIFSMEGKMAPLQELAILAKKYNSWMMVDDAHGIGIFGNLGSGTLNACKLTTNDVAILVGTLGKAIGTMGAFVAGDSALIATIRQFARTYIFTTAPPPAIAAATLTSLQILSKDTWRRERLSHLIQRFISGCNSIGIKLMPSKSPIQPLLTPKVADTLFLQQALFEQNILVTAIRPPTVPANQPRLRITINATHTEKHIDKLLEALSTANLKPKNS